MNILISGGAKNGKSDVAVRLARRMAGLPEAAGAADLCPDAEAAGGISRVPTGIDDAADRPLYYIATMIPGDAEDRARIRAHVRARQGLGFRTLEQGTAILRLLEQKDVDPAGVFLLDSTTALLSNEMFPAPGETASDWFDPEAARRIPGQLAEFARRTGNTVFVSDGIYSDARIPAAAPDLAPIRPLNQPPDQISNQPPDLTEYYRRALAAADRELARICDVVLEVSAGMVTVWKGGTEWNRRRTARGGSGEPEGEPGALKGGNGAVIV